MLNNFRNCFFLALVQLNLKFLGISDHTGTVRGYLEARLFDQEMMINGNFTEMLPGILDVIYPTLYLEMPILKFLFLDCKHFYF